MSGKSNYSENSLLQLIFQNANAFPNLGDATGLRGSAAAGNLYVALHTADPGKAGSAVTSETAYTGYARVAVPRSSAGFTVTANSVSPVNNVDFPQCTAAPGAAITFFSIVDTASGAGNILYTGALSPTIAMAVGVIPRVQNTSSITEN